MLIVGLVLIAVMLGVSIHAVIAIPYQEAIRLWRAGPGVWEENARCAAPTWFDRFTRYRLPRTTVIDLDEATITRETVGDGIDHVEVVLSFNYNYDRFPQELSLFTGADLQQGYAHVSLYWLRPDGQMITLQEDGRIRESGSYRLSQDAALHTRLGVAPHVGLFAEDLDMPAADMKVLRGDYQMIMEGELWEGDEFLDVRLVVYGQVEGHAGTDHRRRELSVALLWGAPLALWSTVWPAALITGLAAMFLWRRRARRSDVDHAPRPMKAALLPFFFLLVSALVFLRAALDVVGLGDPMLPTWGKVIHDARMNDALSVGLHYWVSQPAILIVMTGLGFALMGYSLHHIFNPKEKTAE